MAMTKTRISADMRAKAALEEQIQRSIKAFLRSWLLHYFPDPNKEIGFHGSNAAKVFGFGQGYLSEVGRFEPIKTIGLDLLIRLREVTGATYEDITGHRPPLRPVRPYSRTPYGLPIAEEAADRALSAVHDGSTESGHGMRALTTGKRESMRVPAPPRLLGKTEPRSPDLLGLLRHHPMRWCAGAVAAALTLPASARTGVDAWADLLDALDVAVREIVLSAK